MRVEAAGFGVVGALPLPATANLEGRTKPFADEASDEFVDLLLAEMVLDHWSDDEDWRFTVSGCVNDSRSIGAKGVGSSESSGTGLEVVEAESHDGSPQVVDRHDLSAMTMRIHLRPREISTHGVVLRRAAFP